METQKKEERAIWKALESVKDPEIPVLSIVDLGIVVSVSADINEGKASVTMTPTFSGCPAIKLMEKQVKDTIIGLGYNEVNVETNFDVAWNSNMISPKGLEALKSFKIAPPRKYEGSFETADVAIASCPNCGSENTTMKSPFGPTLCRSLHYCYDCLEAFEQFKQV
jgi:ring-1,2-phenylacetyl-CoA epoxidase subunit PaaD